MMDRNEKILYFVDKSCPGVEIGPSHAPIAPKKKGFNVDIIDHATREELILKYQDHDVNLDNIEHVDFVWEGQSYKELTGKVGYYKWIIASHVIEHMPDIINYLNNCEELLTDDGVLSLAIPDYRYCFDCFKPLTSIGKVIDSHLLNKIHHSVGDLVESYLNSVRRNGNIAWDNTANINDKYEFIFDVDNVHEYYYDVKNSDKYIDCHAWCFTPESFKLLMYDLNLLGMTSLKIKKMFPTQGCEFFVTLTKEQCDYERNRIGLLINLMEKNNFSSEQSSQGFCFKFFKKISSWLHINNNDKS